MPPEETSCSPLSYIVVELTIPPEEIYCRPQEDIVVKTAEPPEYMYCIPFTVSLVATIPPLTLLVKDMLPFSSYIKNLIILFKIRQSAS